MTQEKKTGIVLALLIGFVAVMLVFFSDTEQSPQIDAHSSIRELKAPILEFAEKNGNPPASLEELGLSVEATSDPSGKPLVYEIDGRTITISSLGADGEPGGHAFNADKTITFDW